MSHLFTHCWISHTIIIVPFLVVVAPIRRKRDRLPTCTQNCESKNEIDDLSAPIQPGGHDIVVFDEPVWSILAKIELGHDADGIVEEQGAVCAMRENGCGNY
jgi:hypothetical protein